MLNLSTIGFNVHINLLLQKRYIQVIELFNSELVTTINFLMSTNILGSKYVSDEILHKESRLLLILSLTSPRVSKN